MKEILHVERFPSRRMQKQTQFANARKVNSKSKSADPMIARESCFGASDG